VAAIKTTARKDGGDYVINGSKMWITNGTAGRLVLPAGQHQRGRPHKNKSLIVRADGPPGITRAKIHKIGMNSSDTAQLHFDNVRVPRAG
jgi:citronellyl-CoA dehydrogenase